VTRSASALDYLNTLTAQSEPSLRDAASQVPDHRGDEDDEEEADDGDDVSGFVEDEDEYDNDNDNDDDTVDDSDDGDYEPIESNGDDDRWKGFRFDYWGCYSFFVGQGSFR
jgi:hypothetical protein